MRIRGQGGGIEVQHKSTAPRRGGAGEHDIPSWQQGSNIRMWTRDGNRPEKTSHLANFINVRLILLKIQRLKIAVKLGFPGSSVVKNPPASAGDMGSIPGSGKFPGEGNGTPPQYSCLGNPMDREAWWATVCGSQKSQTRLSD